MRRIYVPEGCTPVASVNWKFEWLWVYGFVEPQSGETYWWILPYVNSQLFNRVLEDVAKVLGLGKDKRILLVVDQAGWHTSKQVRVPEGLHLIFLPSHSPELQPAERLWPVVDEPIANRSFENLEQLEEVLYQRCQTLLKQLELIAGLTDFYWWSELLTIS